MPPHPPALGEFCTTRLATAAASHAKSRSEDDEPRDIRRAERRGGHSFNPWMGFVRSEGRAVWMFSGPTSPVNPLFPKKASEESFGPTRCGLHLITTAKHGIQLDARSRRCNHRRDAAAATRDPPEKGTACMRVSATQRASGRLQRAGAGAGVSRDNGKEGILRGGTYRYANGNVYEGEFKADKQEGRGRIQLANNEVYEASSRRIRATAVAPSCMRTARWSRAFTKGVDRLGAGVGGAPTASCVAAARRRGGGGDLR